MTQRHCRRPCIRRAAALRETLHGELPRRSGALDLRRGRARSPRARVASAGRAAGSICDQRIDRIVTSPIFGLPIMALLLAVVFWLTIAGANVPSAMLANGFFWFEDQRGRRSSIALGAPWWLTGFIWHGVFRGLAWVISVMLPPMAIFFPLFTILEDLGYLPRVAFNLDFLFKRAGAHGKQALTMAMGFGCNAAGIIATRVIDSPRERLVAILTNNFVPCNGRFPTLIMLATIFVGAAFPPAFASLAAAGAVVGVVVIGVVFTLVVSWALSRTILRGEASAFTLELPPYRRPGVAAHPLHVADRSDAVRAVARDADRGARPAPSSGFSATSTSAAPASRSTPPTALNPLGHAIGLDGVILLAYIIAIPANEIVVPDDADGLHGHGDDDRPGLDVDDLRTLLVDKNGWTLLTAVNLMLFSLLHNPCATTIMTIYKETLSRKWATIGALMPLDARVHRDVPDCHVARLLGWAN